MKGKPKQDAAGSFSVEAGDKKKNKQKAPVSEASRGAKRSAKEARTESHKTSRLARHLSRNPHWNPEKQADIKDPKKYAVIPADRVIRARSRATILVRNREAARVAREAIAALA